ncbi:MAG: FkbM family methyltransferase [bacterium]
MFKAHLSTIKHLLHILIVNPRFFLKRVISELRAFVSPLPKKPVLKNINGVMFNFYFAYSDKIKKMYFGTFQPSVEEVLKKYLKNGDTFIDVGANIGYFSLIAAGLVGKNGQVHSFEPVPEYFQKLKKLSEANTRYEIMVNQFALGDKEKIEKIYIGGPSHIGNNTFFPDLLNGIKEIKNASVSIRRLDKYIKEKNINNIKLIKIDVEGFEFFVLKGLEEFFLECSKNRSCPLIICEIVPEVYINSGQRLGDVFEYMAKFSYFPFDVINTKKRININEVKKRRTIDVLFKPDKLK